jgi:PAS domain S-box-containing protein
VTRECQFYSPAPGFDVLARDIETAQRRSEALRHWLDHSPDPERFALVFQELQTALEELHATHDELLRQNEELAAAREESEAEHRRYQDLFEFAPDAYLLTSPDGTVREANRAATVLLNRPPRFLTGKPLVVFVPEDERRAFRDHLHRLRGVVRHEWEMRLRPWKGKPLDASWAAAAVRESSGKLTALRWLVRDVTARKEAERLRAIGDMVSGLAHASRNALQRSLACLERLRWEVKDQPHALDLAARTLQAQEDLHRLLEEARAYTAPVQVTWQLCDPAAAWRAAWDELAPARGGRRAELREEVPTAAPSCLGDPALLKQLFCLLFDQALAHCADPVYVTVACSPAEQGERPAVRVVVRDNGPGPSPEQRQKPFEPFAGRVTQGAALNMALCKRLVEAQGGQIGLGDGPGTEVVLTLSQKQSERRRPVFPS